MAAQWKVEKNALITARFLSVWPLTLCLLFALNRTVTDVIAMEHTFP